VVTNSSQDPHGTLLRLGRDDDGGGYFLSGSHYATRNTFVRYDCVLRNGRVMT
jgi:hypothetical protein